MPWQGLSVRKQGGIPSTDLVLSARVSGNAEVFADILRLHVPLGSIVADVTYGKGAFWKRVPDEAYQLLASDIKTGIPWSCLPYGDASVDAVVFDPPYIEGFYRRTASALAGSGTHATFREAYSDGCPQADLHIEAASPVYVPRKYHEAVLEAYLSGMAEVMRILRPGGKLVLKCQDEVSANRQRLTHVELIWALEARGFHCKDLFVVVRSNSPGVSRMLKQEHARKNHSYFLVLERQDHKAKVAHSNFGAWLRE